MEGAAGGGGRALGLAASLPFFLAIRRVSTDLESQVLPRTFLLPIYFLFRLIVFIFLTSTRPIIHPIIHISPNSIINDEVIFLQPSLYDALVLVFCNFVVEFDFFFLE
jgi:hypothetical protein